jgi:molybdate transport system substrate-binding protein
VKRAFAIVAAAILASSCGRAGADGRSQTLTVFGAASLTEAFTEIAHAFEAEHPGLRVRLSFGPSDGLATQIQEGAPADVFASASPTWMDAVAEDPGVSDRRDFARNRLIVITPADDPAGISSVEDLARPGVTLVLAAEGVPVGDYARQLLDNAGIADAALANVVSNEDDVKGVVQKVALGEADGGIVYRTDVTPAGAGDLRTIDVPRDLNVIATYPIAAVGGSASDLASAFVDYVTGPGQAALLAAGFLPA